MFKRPSWLPSIATAPFCPSEVQGSVVIPKGISPMKRLALFLGPGLMVAVGYMDPGNWATDLEAGSRYGYGLLFVILLSSLAGMFLQSLSMRVGLITGRTLAELSRDRYNKPTNFMLWIFAEIAIIATDVAEVLGSALAFKLLLGCSLSWGIAITALDTFLILGLKGKGFRTIEAIILGLVSTIGICFFVELFLVKPYWPDVAMGLIPSMKHFSEAEAWYLAIGILGATVMPHNLYLHSSIIHTRKLEPGRQGKATALKFGTIDTIGSLGIAFLVNAAILILAGAAFHASGQGVVTGIDDAYRLLAPIVGTAVAPFLFAIALLAAGQSSTFTGTIAGQIILEGFLNLKIPCWQRRVITRGLALAPAFTGVAIWGENSIGKMLVMSQVVLSLQLPFVIYPLLRYASSKALMDDFRIGWTMKGLGWIIFGLISAANLWLIYRLFT
jgi:manganese transport protein